VTASPVWIRRDISLLESYGGDLPYRDVVLVAAYPMRVLSTTCDFVIYKICPLKRVYRDGTPTYASGELRLKT
jgi:hypothetical protein